MSTERRRIKVGPYLAQLQVEVSPAGVGQVTITWIGEQPGRLTAEQWRDLREAKRRVLARLTGIFGVAAEG